jgi:hypothetical protein
MNVSRFSTGRRRALALVAFLALAALLTTAVGSTTAQLTLPGTTTITTLLPTDVARIEEDWELTVNEPNPDLASPQVSTQMARAPGAARFHNFHLNSVDIPAFSLGGLQLQNWRDTTNLGVYTSSNSAIMATPNELVTWTQYLGRAEGDTVIRFGISGASSTTWGDFSGMQIDIPRGDRHLNDYDPTYSLQNSGVTFGANRVTSLVLVRVRKIYASGLVDSDATPRVVYSSVLDPDLGGGDN